MYFHLAFRNLLRHRIRTSMTLGAIVFGVAGLILAGGFVNDIFIQLGEAIIHSQTGHIQVFKKDFLDKGTRTPDQYLIEQPEAQASRIASLPDVDAVMSRLYFAGLLNNGKRDLAIIGEGVEPGKEARLGSLLAVVAGRQLTDQDSEGILIGQGVAHNLGLSPGDRATLVLNAAGGALNTFDYEVVGVFQSFSKDFDARAVRIPLKSAQELLGTSGANQLVISLKKTESTDSAMSALSQTLAGSNLDFRSWRQLSDFYDKTVQLYDRQFGVLQLIILLMVLLSVANSVNMSVFERMAEFGTMRAIGDRQVNVFRLVMTENALLGLGGALLGVIAGISAALIITRIGIPMPAPPNTNLGYTAYIRIVPGVVVMAFGIGILATVFAAILPARKVARADIVEALRQAI
jgi:putative ABC transport system permease protein